MKKKIINEDGTVTEVLVEDEEPKEGDTPPVEEEDIKTFTQEELDDIVQKRLNREKGKWQKEIEDATKEAERLAKLSAEEREKELSSKRDEELAKTKAELQRVYLEQDTVERLNDEGLPISFKSFLMQEDADQTNSNIITFKTEFDKAVQAEVEKRLVGKTPKIGSSTPGVKNPWSKDTFNLTEQGRILREDPELAEKLKAQAN